MLGEHCSPEELGKALPALHHSQVQQRRRGGQFARQHPSRTQARDSKGRFRGRLTLEEREAARDQAGATIRDQLSPRLHRHLGDFELGRLSSREWYSRCEEDIRLFYELIYRDGQRSVGHPCVKLTPQDKAVIRRLVEDELHYLAGFRDHLDAGAGRMPYHTRMELYAQAAWEAYWYGWLLGDQRKGREVRWHFGKTNEHCGFKNGGKAQGCADFEAEGWLPVAAFVKQVLAAGYAPRSGKLECQGHNCLCYLQERVDGKESPAFDYPAGR